MYDAQVSRINEEVSYKQPGLLKRILWVLTSPGKLMVNLAERPRVLFGLILSALSMEVVYISRLSLFKDTLRSASLASADYTESLTGQTMTAEMVEQNMPFATIFGLISTPFTMVIGLLITTLIFFAILKLMGGQGKFKAYLSVTGYAYVISALYLLLLIPVSFITGSLHENAPLTSLATLASPDMAGTFFNGILKGIDIFSIWHYAVMAIGFTVVSKLKKVYVYGVVAGIFMIGLIIAGVGESALKAFM